MAEKETAAPHRVCKACGLTMEYNPVTKGWFCAVCGRVEKTGESGYEEDQYFSSGEITARAAEETAQKCEACGGTMDYDPQTLMLHCPYCGSSKKLKTHRRGNKAKEVDFETERRRGSRNWGVKTKTVVCGSCGGRTIYDYMQLSGKCLYCGSNQVSEVQTVDVLAPNGVCPFTVTVEQAAGSFKKWLGKMLFCPIGAKRSAEPKEIKGVYLPFWTFDTATASAYRGFCKPGGAIQTTTDTRRSWIPSVAVGKFALQVVLKNMNNTIIAEGTHHQFFNDILVSASDNHNKKMMKQLAPYDTDNSVPYSPEYIAGFPAEQYSVGLEDAWEQAKATCEKPIGKNIRLRIGNEHFTTNVSNVRFTTEFSEITFKYLLLPVWLSSFTYKGKIYQFMVNGRTGKTVGKFPVSKLRAAIAAALSAGIIGALVYMFFFK